MAEPGQKFFQKLMDGKIHECEYVEPYLQYQDPVLSLARTNVWKARVLDNHGGYKQGQTFLCDASY